MDQIRRLAAVDGVVNLLRPIGWLIGAEGFAKIRKVHAHDWLKHPISSLPAGARVKAQAAPGEGCYNGIRPSFPSSAMTTTISPVRDIEMTTLGNGLRVITEAMPHVRSVSVGMWIGSGSRGESGEQNGISHFIEHMLFKGTTRRSAEDIARSVDSIGGNLDAFTAKELVCFNTKVLDQHLSLAFDVLADLVLHPMFREEDIEKEKGVILEEIKMEADSPDYLVHEIFSSNFWKDHPLGKPILGTRETVKRFDRDHDPRLLRLDLRAGQHDGHRGRQPDARAAGGAGAASISRRCAPAIA